MAKTTTKTNPQPKPRPVTPTREGGRREYGDGGKIRRGPGPSGNPAK